MDSRAKQRLTGAVILVALFVLLVPELLTGPREVRPADPTDENGMRRYTIDLSASQTSVQPAAPAASSEVKLPEIAPAVPAPSAPTTSPDTARAVPGEAAAPAPVPSAPVSPTSAAPAPGTAASTPATSARAPITAASTPAASAPARAPAPASAPPPHTEPARIATAAPGAAPRAHEPLRAGSFAVQLGTFENRDNANRLVRDMTAKGFNAFVAPFSKDGRELYRVRVGPTRDRAAAEALAAQLKRAGQSGSVVSIS
jgi:DedD protein